MTKTAQPDLCYSLTMRATPDRVWRALTAPEALRAWFAEHADVDPRVGGAWRFWGRNSLGVPTPDAADQRIVALEPEKLLAFTWTWSGVPTRVELALEPKEWKEFTLGSNPPLRPNAPGCAVTVRQSFAGTLPYPRPESLADDHWRLALANLFAHLDGAEVSLVDHTDSDCGGPEVRLSIFVAAPPAAVFRALTEPALLDRWIGSGARIDPRVGGGVDLGWSGCGGPGAGEPADLAASPMKILELVPDRRFAISWPDWRGDASVPMQRVTWDLAPENSGTRVELRHTGFVRAVDRSDYFQGWSSFLEALASVAMHA
jgi:uncharacterized protein YndB with AHSA1/START domain